LTGFWFIHKPLPTKLAAAKASDCDRTQQSRDAKRRSLILSHPFDQARRGAKAVAGGTGMTVTQRDRDLGTGYAMKPSTTRTELASARRGTPRGELLRRYLHPVGLSPTPRISPEKCACTARIWCCFAADGLDAGGASGHDPIGVASDQGAPPVEFEAGNFIREV
jgi:hypothetical protein